MPPLRRTGLGFSSSASNLTDGVYENQLMPNFQRVTICGEDASEVSSFFCTEVLKEFGNYLAILCHLFVVLFGNRKDTSLLPVAEQNIKILSSPAVLNDFPIETQSVVE